MTAIIPIMSIFFIPTILLKIPPHFAAAVRPEAAARRFVVTTTTVIDETLTKNRPGVGSEEFGKSAGDIFFWSAKNGEARIMPKDGTLPHANFLIFLMPCY